MTSLKCNLVWLYRNIQPTEQGNANDNHYGKDKQPVIMELSLCKLKINKNYANFMTVQDKINNIEFVSCVGDEWLFRN